MNDDLAIMDLNDIREYLIECNYNVEAIDYAIKVIKKPKGKWITHAKSLLVWEECDQCHVQVGTVGMNFCPNCGADMREDSTRKG